MVFARPQRFLPLRPLLWALLFWLAALAPARACPVCIDLPDATLADRVLADWMVVLARPSAADPFRYAPVKILSGRAEKLALMPPIPFLIDGASRKALTADPQAAMLFSYGARTTGPGDEAWAQLGLITPEREKIVTEILRKGQDWDWGSTSDPARFKFFARLLSRSDPLLQRLAMEEISRAPYRLIRTLPGSLSVPALERRLSRADEAPFAPLYILFLGLAEGAEARALVQRNFTQALAVPGPRLDAWVVAGIEQEGRAALDQIAAWLARNPRLSAEDWRRLTTGLTVTGSARPRLRKEILPLLRSALARAPHLVEPLAYASYEWDDWSLAPDFEALLESGQPLDHPTRYILEIVVTSARKAGAI